jgi:hypothetical protein
VPSFDQDVGGRHDPAARRADDRGVVAGTQLDGGSRAHPGAQTCGDTCDDPELAEFPDGDDLPPVKTRYGGRLTAVPGRT